MKHIIIILGLVSLNVHADDWICKTQSVIKQSTSTIMTCGVGESQNKLEARDSAREDAIMAFRKYCDSSSDCRDFDYNVEPKRLDCESQNGTVICYQAIQFNILEVKRKDILLNLPDVEKALTAKKREVAIQENRINQLKELKEQSELSEKNQAKLEILEKNVDKVQGEKIKLEQEVDTQSGYQYTHDLFKNSFKVSTSYWSTDFFKKGETDVFLNLGYEYRPTRHLGLGVNYGFGTDLSSAGNTPSNTGTAGTQSAQSGSVKIKDLSVNANLYVVEGLYLKGEVGMVQASQNVYSVSYGPLGTQTRSSTSQVSVSKAYAGASVGYDSRNHEKGLGFFSEVGVRESVGDGKVGVVGVVGFNFGF